MATQALQERFYAIGGTTRLIRDTMLFLGGAEVLHTVSHVWMAFAVMLPMTVPVFPSVTVTLTEGVNLFAIFANGIIAAGLLYGAHRLKK
jgi:hypothetical protein